MATSNIRWFSSLPDKYRDIIKDKISQDFTKVGKEGQKGR